VVLPEATKIGQPMAATLFPASLAIFRDVFCPLLGDVQHGASACGAVIHATSARA
jgi:hypothetical protein